MDIPGIDRAYCAELVRRTLQPDYLSSIGNSQWRVVDFRLNGRCNASGYLGEYYQLTVQCDGFGSGAAAEASAGDGASSEVGVCNDFNGGKTLVFALCITDAEAKYRVGSCNYNQINLRYKQ